MNLSDTTRRVLTRLAVEYAKAGCPDHGQWPITPGADEAGAFEELTARGILETPKRGLGTWWLTDRGRSELPALPTPEQRTVLNWVGDHQLTRNEPIAATVLRKRLKAAKLEEGESLIVPLEKLYLNPIVGPDGQLYVLTVSGWLASVHKDKVANLVQGVLVLLKQRLEAESQPLFVERSKSQDSCLEHRAGRRAALFRRAAHG